MLRFFQKIDIQLENTSSQKIFLFVTFSFLLFLYSPSFYGPFTLDDSHTIVNNGIIQSFDNFSSIWLSAKSYSSLPATWGYRPVNTTVNAFLWWIGDGSTLPFHLFKFLLFFSIILLLKRIWVYLYPHKIPNIVLYTCLLLFLINPVHSQVLIYVSSTSSLLCGLFVILSVWSSILYKDTGDNKYYLIAFFSIVFGLLSKESGIVAIALIALVELYDNKIKQDQYLNNKSLKRLLMYLVPTIIGLGLIILMYEPTTGLARGTRSGLTYFMTQWRAYLRYFAMFIYSYDLNLDNLNFGFSDSFFDWKVISSLIINIGLLLLSVVIFNKKPWFLFVLLWFYVAISPASSIVPLGEPVNDHRAFLGYFIFGLPLFYFFDRIRRFSIELFFTVSLIFIIVYSGQTYHRAKQWSTNESIWRDTVVKNPTSPRAINNLTVELMSQARYQEALEVISGCAKIGATYYNCYTNMAILLATQGRDNEAEENFRKGIQFDKTIYKSRYFYIKFLRQRGFIGQPLALIKEADKFTRGVNLMIRAELIDLTMVSGKTDLAKKLWSEALDNIGKHEKLLSMGERYGFNK